MRAEPTGQGKRREAAAAEQQGSRSDGGGGERGETPFRWKTFQLCFLTRAMLWHDRGEQHTSSYVSSTCIHCMTNCWSANWNLLGNELSIVPEHCPVPDSSLGFISLLTWLDLFSSSWSIPERLKMVDNFYMLELYQFDQSRSKLG